ncbi:MAG: D-alanyl-D-alanine endopeptidase, partial [Gammaproteobacteria bacterium HGW-Gammaproteobacteria-7]
MNFRRTLASLFVVCLASLPVLHAQAAKPAVQELASGSALLVDLNTNEVLYSSNPDMVVPIASVTKLMTAIVALDAKLPLDQVLPVTIRDAKEMQGVFS